MKWRVLISCVHLQRKTDHYRRLFAEHGVEIELPEVTQQLSEAELCGMIERFDGIIAGDDELTAKVMEKGERLKVIVKWGIGVDAIDFDAAERLGIKVFNTPDVFADEVSDVAIGYVIMLARQLHKMDQSVREGGWLKVQGMSLSGKTMGIIGLGSIGRAVARRAAAMNMSLAGYDVAPLAGSFIEETGLRPLGLDELLRISDVIALNCNLTARNRHMLGREQFAIMKKGAYVVNTARGGLIDEKALIEALREGKIAGAALDVFEREPLPLESPLRGFDNCIFGTHNGSNTREAVMRVNDLAVRKLLDTLEGNNQ